MEKRRQNERVTINKEFESFDSFIQEYVTNISRSGVFIKSRQPLPVGTRVNLRFTVIMEDIETIEGTGEVVRVEIDPPGMGVVFTSLTSYSKRVIERLPMRLHAAHQVLEVLQVGHFHVLLVAELGDDLLDAGAADLPGVDGLQRAATRARAGGGIDAVGAHGVHSFAYRLTISSAARAASAPLLPALVPARSMACSMVSVVSTPKATGTPLS